MRSLLSTAIAAVLVAVSVAEAQEPSRPAEIPRYAPAPSVARAAAPATTSAAPSAAPAAAPVARAPRIGYAAEPAPPPQPVYQPQPQYYYYSQNGYVITGPSYLVLTDGSVAVNFGNGYERVLRSCVALQPAVAPNPWGRDALGRIPEPPGIAAMRIGARGQAYGNAPAMNSVACYRSDAQGRVEVVTLRQ